MKTSLRFGCTPRTRIRPTAVSSAVLAALVLSALLLAFSSVCHGQSSKFVTQETFHVSVTGSFRQDTPTPCTYCDGDNTWVDNATCPSMGITEPDDNQQRWGVCDTAYGVVCNCFPSSGVGFRGMTNVTIVSNPVDGTPTKIGRMTHYNNEIFGVSPTELRLTIEMDAPELSQPFVISYPLNFFETPNTKLSECDPAIQQTNVPCDDQFAFSELTISDNFTRDNVEYTLEIVGFVQNSTVSLKPINGFVTKESTINFADVYARIVTACAISECGTNEVFQAPPVCGCVCAITDGYCRTENGGNPYYKGSNDTCSCECTLTAADCPANSTYDATACSCGCSLTDSDCKQQSANYVVSPDPTVCGCVCSSELVSACQAQGRFWNTSAESCDCYCAVTDQLCQQIYGSGYSADASTCGCSGSGGLNNGQIAGIVVGAAVGACLLATLFAGLAALLAFLIRRGSMPGIYGVRIDDPGFSNASHSPLYNDPWQGNDNVMRG